MLYIAQSKREVLNPAINAVVDALRQLESDDDKNNFEGNLNYVVSTIISKVYNRSYRSVNDVIGVLTCISMEYYRRVAAPYENQKSFENGDVYDLPSVKEVVQDKIETRTVPFKRGNPTGDTK